jgi:hypothetical protein
MNPACILRRIPVFMAMSFTACARSLAFQPSSIFHISNSVRHPLGYNVVQQKLYMATEERIDTDMPSFIKSPVLEQVYPALLTYVKEYGHPNIPLGTSEGRKCKTLRRLAFEKKLTEEEMNLLTELNFRFNSFEDVYEEADFDECLQRLLDYEAEFKTNYQIPKKYKPDPELGAWVTMIRRIGSDNIEPSRREKLDAIGFAWVSTRKCGSAFMKAFKSLKARLESCYKLNDEGVWEIVDQAALDEVLSDKDVMKWVKAQKLAAEKGLLSDSRCGYMDDLPGLNWRE